MKKSYIVHGILILLVAIALSFLVQCLNRDTWFDDGEKYLCPECKYLNYYGYGVYCERCNEPVPYGPVTYCYDCAKELNCCQRCGYQR